MIDLIRATATVDSRDTATATTNRAATAVEVVEVVAEPVALVAPATVNKNRATTRQGATTSKVTGKAKLRLPASLPKPNLPAATASRGWPGNKGMVRRLGTARATTSSR